MRVFSLLLVLGFVAVGVIACASAVGPEEVVKITYGITKVDLTGEGYDAFVVFGRRENFNAHGFDVLSMYINASLDKGALPIWNIVPIFNGEKEQLELMASGGADGLLYDFRLLRDSKKHGIRLITATRAFGETYADENDVTFDYYELKRNSEGLVGEPIYYFEKSSSSKAKKRYSDVGAAFKDELGLGQYITRLY